ncbi:MAG: N-acetyl-gamma-glutamyl-phosphate reductase [Bernardetiaceae bacterium]|nr:N-acetyl-gamma-glutamyl-phosphate reductase [Bernardetiaceae bacterium]
MSNSSKISVAIVGATGFTGSELASLLYMHEATELRYISSESHAGKAFSDIHPQFTGIIDMPLCKADDIDIDAVEVVFLALPHGISMEYVKKWYDSDVKMIDFSGDYRLSSAEVYEDWYQKKHSFTQVFEEAVYGLPELFEAQIKAARIVANPGCYPTASILGLYPLVQHQLIDTKRIIIDAKSGTTGAGVKPKAGTMFTHVNDNFFAYGLKNHRHTVEIQEILSHFQQAALEVQFTPHLLPIDRGILATIYAPAQTAIDDATLRKTYEEAYAHSDFIRIRKTPPTLKEVRASHYCDIYPTFDARTGNVIVLSAIDNLMRGASSQALHNFNLMFGLAPDAGLRRVPLKP